MAVGFGLQIYFDFASYSRMAIGSARLCGIELVENFNNPYLARSPADFWNRWHMSLSRWIRDYVFFPMVGKKTTLNALMRAAIGSMVLCGVWHGAGWTFVAWGTWHGLGVASYHLLTHQNRSTPAETTPDRPVITMIAIVATFAFVMLGWIFFRSTSVVDAFFLVGRALWPLGGLHRTLSGTFYLQVAAVTGCVWLFPIMIAKLERSISKAPAWIKVGGRGLAWGTLACVSLLYLRGQTAFIYFQF
jgi:alginate O-acetyltransferase complex protein AlgI